MTCLEVLVKMEGDSVIKKKKKKEVENSSSREWYMYAYKYLYNFKCRWMKKQWCVVFLTFSCRVYYSSLYMLLGNSIPPPTVADLLLSWGKQETPCGNPCRNPSLDHSFPWQHLQGSHCFQFFPDSTPEEQQTFAPYYFRFMEEHCYMMIINLGKPSFKSFIE